MTRPLRLAPDYIRAWLRRLAPERGAHRVPGAVDRWRPEGRSPDCFFIPLSKTVQRLGVDAGWTGISVDPKDTHPPAIHEWFPAPPIILLPSHGSLVMSKQRSRSSRSRPFAGKTGVLERGWRLQPATPLGFGRARPPIRARSAVHPAEDLPAERRGIWRGHAPVPQPHPSATSDCGDPVELGAWLAVGGTI